MRFVRIKSCITGFVCSFLHYSLFTTRISAEHMQFALQLVDLWDNEHPKRMRRLHPGIRAWRVSRSSVSGVMVNSEWNLIQYKMQAILPASCVFCLLFTVMGHRRDEAVSLWGRDFTLSSVPSVVSAGQAGKQRRCWLWAALGGVRKLELLQLGAWRGRIIWWKREWWAAGWNGSCWQGASPQFKRKQWETQQKKTWLCLLHFYYWDWNTNVFFFFLMPQFEINRKAYPPLPNPLHQSVRGCLTFIRKKLGKLNAILLQIFKSKTQSWWKSPVTRVSFRQPRAIRFQSGGENPPVILASLATQVGAVTRCFEGKKYLIILSLK